MLLFRAFLVSLASASIDLPRDWQAQHCRGTHLEHVAGVLPRRRRAADTHSSVSTQAFKVTLTVGDGVATSDFDAGSELRYISETH